MDKNSYDIEALPYHCRKIARSIGLDNLLKVADAVGGEYLFIPKRNNLLKHLRRQYIKEDLAAGMTREQVAEKYNISVRQVYRIQKE